MTVDVVSKTSLAAKSICMWVHAMDVYSVVAKEVAPKQAKLAEMNKLLDKANSKLAEKQRSLKEVEDKVADLQDQLDKAMAEAKRLKDAAALTASRLERAEKLTNGLAAEHIRWKASVGVLEQQLTDLAGDVFLCAGAISYLGAFTGRCVDGLSSI